MVRVGRSKRKVSEKRKKGEMGRGKKIIEEKRKKRRIKYKGTFTLFI